MSSLVMVGFGSAACYAISAVFTVAGELNEFTNLSALAVAGVMAASMVAGRFAQTSTASQARPQTTLPSAPAFLRWPLSETGKAYRFLELPGMDQGFFCRVY
jgi:hypothetical protein